MYRTCTSTISTLRTVLCIFIIATVYVLAYCPDVQWSVIADAAMSTVGAKITYSESHDICVRTYVLCHSTSYCAYHCRLRTTMFAHCTAMKCTVLYVPLYILGDFAAVYFVTAVMCHSCVVCDVTAGDVVNSQLATAL